MVLLGWFFLALQAAIVVASLLGYGIFTARPDLLAQVDPQARFFTWAFSGFAIGNMAFGGLAVLAEALARQPRAALLAFVAVYGVTLASELLGTTYGIPFGAYSYTTLLGPKWFERVPLLIPLSWFTVGWAAWVIARRWTRGWAAVALGTALLIAWDLLLDPAMSKVTSYWVWGEAGAYYGMPWVNLAGWGITGLIMLALIFRFAPRPRSSFSFACSVYAVNYALPLGFCLLNRYWPAVIASVGAAGVAWIVARTFSGAAVARPEPRTDESPPPRGASHAGGAESSRRVEDRRPPVVN